LFLDLADLDVAFLLKDMCSAIRCLSAKSIGSHAISGRRSLPDSRIHDCHMDGAVRKIFVARFPRIGAVLDIVGADMMGEIDDRGWGLIAEDDPFMLATNQSRSPKSVRRVMIQADAASEPPLRSRTTNLQFLNLISMTWYSIVFDGRRTSIKSPTRFPINARLTGD
jgi:hypothetical protein